MQINLICHRFEKCQLQPLSGRIYVPARIGAFVQYHEGHARYRSTNFDHFHQLRTSAFDCYHQEGFQTATI